MSWVKYADRVVAARQKYLDIGTQFGAQRMADLVSIALNDPAVMGETRSARSGSAACSSA